MAVTPWQNRKHWCRVFLFPGEAKTESAWTPQLVNDLLLRFQILVLDLARFLRCILDNYWLEEIIRLWWLYYPNQHISNPTICKTHINKYKIPEWLSLPKAISKGLKPLSHPYTLCLWQRGSGGFILLQAAKITCKWWVRS